MTEDIEKALPSPEAIAASKMHGCLETVGGYLASRSPSRLRNKQSLTPLQATAYGLLGRIAS